MTYNKFLNIKNFFLIIYSIPFLLLILILTFNSFREAIIDFKKTFYLHNLKYHAQSENRIESIQAVLVTLSQTIPTDKINTKDIYKSFEKVSKATGFF